MVVGVQPAGHAGVVGVGQDPLPHGVQVGPALGHAELVPGGIVVAGAVLLGVPAHKLIALPVGQPAHVLVVPDLHGPVVVGLIEGLVVPEVGVVVQGVVAVLISAAATGVVVVVVLIIVGIGAGGAGAAAAVGCHEGGEGRGRKFQIAVRLIDSERIIGTVLLIDRDLNLLFIVQQIAQVADLEVSAQAVKVDHIVGLAVFVRVGPIDVDGILSRVGQRHIGIAIGVVHQIQIAELGEGQVGGVNPGGRKRGGCGLFQLLCDAVIRSQRIHQQLDIVGLTDRDGTLIDVIGGAGIHVSGDPRDCFRGGFCPNVTDCIALIIIHAADGQRTTLYKDVTLRQHVFQSRQRIITIFQAQLDILPVQIARVDDHGVLLIQAAC